MDKAHNFVHLRELIENYYIKIMYARIVFLNQNKVTQLRGTSS